MHGLDQKCDCHLQGFLEVPVAGTYNFTLTTTDGSRLTLDPSPGDDVVLINNDGELVWRSPDLVGWRRQQWWRAIQLRLPQACAGRSAAEVGPLATMRESTGLPASVGHVTHALTTPPCIAGAHHLQSASAPYKFQEAGRYAILVEFYRWESASCEFPSDYNDGQSTCR